MAERESSNDVVKACSRRQFLGASAVLGLGAATASAQCPDTNGDGVVDVQDLLNVITGWGPTKECPGVFRDFDYVANPTSVAFNLGIPRTGSGAVVAQLSGLLEVSPEGVVNGAMTVTWVDAPSVVTEIMVNNNDVLVQTGDSTLDMQIGDPSNLVLVDGSPLPAPDVLEMALAEWNLVGNPAVWSGPVQNLAAITALASTCLWQQNVNVAIAGGFLSTSFWCKLSCIGIGGLVTIILTLGCATVLAACATATTVTLGGVAVPCAWAVAVCAGGVFIGSTAAYEAWLAFVWG